MSIFESFSGVEIFYGMCGVGGGIFVVVKAIGLFMGVDADAADGADADLDLDGEGHSDSDAGFRFLSIHGLSSFLMMFGFVGLALSRQNNAAVPFSLLGGGIAGIVTFWLMAKIFRAAAGLQSSGTLSIKAALNCTGKISERIPANGTGRVIITVKKRLREYDAVHLVGDEVPTGSQVRVIEVEGNKLTIEVIQ